MKKKVKKLSALQEHLAERRLDFERDYALRLRAVVAIERMVKVMELLAAHATEPRLR